VTAVSDREQSEKNAAHAARLALCKTHRERVHYACEVLATPRPESGRVLDFLELYGYLPNRDRQKRHVYTLVSTWRRERGMADTGTPIPAMTPEMLTLLDERVAASETVSEQTRPSLQVVREHADTAPVETSEPAPEQAAPVADEETSPRPAQAPEVERRHSGSGEVPATSTPVRKRRAPLVLGLISMVAMGLSADTSLRFFKERLHVDDPYRFFLFGVMELTLLGCALAMFESVRDHGRPGPMRFVAWSVCAVSGFAALELSGPLDGPIRTLLGPVLALILLHAALGIEIRAHRPRTTMWTRIGREFRERFLSRLGLGDDSRDAVTRTRERAALRFAHLTEAKFVPFRRARLRRAARAANLAHDPAMKERAMREHAIISNLEGLKEVEHDSVW
jgi:hypothetical protein